MGKKLYVYSTLSADVNYTEYAPGGGDIPVEVGHIMVRGGAGVANDRLVTPRGVVTEVTEEQAEKLRQNKVFQMHEKNGFVQISEISVDPEKAAADMEGRDGSAPVVPQDLPADLQPTTGDPEDAPPARSRRK